MSGAVNKCIIVGNLGKDPEIRRNQSGDRIANLSVATSETWRDKQSGDRRERTEWHRVVIFGDALAGIAEQYLKKGSKVYLEGQLQTRKWQDQSGNDRYSTEIVLQPFRGTLTMLDSPTDGQREANRDDTRSSLRPDRDDPRTGTGTSGGARYDDLDQDDIPF